ncbi:hypothetical protein [Spirochaeta isovalerica]|uniref:Uncharacterized protein n=1 Tax=Spirochaeta isovalerica TaxID=150 RepID=A0A841R6R2_9SPIO|nr:hypothetical protein [Spirochaeta isovalerica]MBB6479523.1 hypothetical protein [Spirochaeta isovalerica]
MSISGFIQTEYFVNDYQKPLISGQALYQNSYFENFDEVDYSFLKNEETGSVYLYVVNDLYESVILVPEAVIAALITKQEKKTVTFTTSVDWLFGGTWHKSSVLSVSIEKRDIGGQPYLVVGSEAVASEEDSECLYQLYDIYFDLTETGRIISRFQGV